MCWPILLSHFKSNFNGPRGPIWAIISETAHVMTNVGKKPIYKVIDYIS